MLRFVRPEEVREPAELGRYRSLLTDGERAKVDRFVHERDRHIQLVARASLRLFLAEHAGVPATDLEFRLNEYGKPFVAFPKHCLNIRFNVSHTAGLIAVLVEDGVEVGVDVEAIRPLDHLPDLASRFFAPAEAEDLRGYAEEAARARFFQYWTLKESYIKARGMGLSLPLDRFWFEIPEAGAPRIRFAPGFDDSPERWDFWQSRIGESHYAATTVERRS